MKIRRLLAFGAMIVLLCPMSGCEKNEDDTKYNSIATDAFIGVIETGVDSEETYIHQFNENLNEVGVLFYPCAQLSSSWDYAQVNSKKMYAIMDGVSRQGCGAKVVEVDLKSAAYNICDFNNIQAMHFAVNDSYIFTNCISGDISITQYNKKEIDLVKKLKKISFTEYKDEMLGNMFLFDDRLYMISERVAYSDKHFSCLYVIDINLMKVLYEINVEQNFTWITDAYKSGDRIIFSGDSCCDVYGNETNPTGLISFDVNTRKISEIPLDDGVVRQMVPYMDVLLLTHYNKHTDSGNAITVYDEKNATSYSCEFNHPLQQVQISGDTLYALSESVIYAYEISRSDSKLTFTLQRSVNVTNENNGEFYIGSFFLF